jgi:hypothetical protein
MDYECGNHDSPHHDPRQLESVFDLTGSNASDSASDFVDRLGAFRLAGD